MAIIKWKTSNWSDAKIERVECTRETPQTVWYMEKAFSIVRGDRPPVERQAAKQSEHHNYHDSWEAAHSYLFNRAEGNVAGARRALEHANGTLGNVKGMK